MDDARPAKRTRQACDPCRRKKTRCPGEKPVCSYCHRLGQKCEYNDNELDASLVSPNRKMEDRMDNLEGKLDQVLEQLLPAVTALRRNPSPSQVPTPGTYSVREDTSTPNRRSTQRRVSSTSGPEDQRPRTRASNRPATLQEDPYLQDVEIHEAALLYLTWCHRQPLVLFDTATFLQSVPLRDLELLLALQALCLRFPPGSLTSQKQARLRAMAKRSRHMAMERVVRGEVALSTLQTLAMLSLVDIADGQVVQASINLALANNLACGVPHGSTLGDAQEFNECQRTIVLLANLHGSVLTGPPLPGPTPMDGQSSSSNRNRDAWWQKQAPVAAVRDANQAGGRYDADILTYTAQLAEVYHMARGYAASGVRSDAPPPWHPSSDYSLVTQRHVDVDCTVPLKHRFSGSRFAEQSAADLQNNRHYWGPWLFLQFIYAAIPCLLNHPFLLSLRLRNFRDTLPQAFIHQSFELISRQAGWITYFISLLEKKSFQLSDPSLAHCVAIVASIHLQHSFVQEQSLREKSQAGFEKCVRFLRGMGAIWPHVETMADNLEKLQRSVVVLPSDSQGDTQIPQGRQRSSIDVDLLRNILIYEMAGQQDAMPDVLMFGASLTSLPVQNGGQDNGGADYDLVGSAGISGHKSVPQETPLYPPDEVEPPRTEAGDFQSATGTGWSVADRYFDGVAVEDDFEGMCFQADDFGRAIDGWMNFQLG